MPMTLDEYQHEYERLFNWRELWAQLSNKMESGRLAKRQEAIEHRAHIANQRIGKLITTYDQQLKDAMPEQLPPERIWIQKDLSFFQLNRNGTYYRDPDKNSFEYISLTAHEREVAEARLEAVAVFDAEIVRQGEFGMYPSAEDFRSVFREAAQAKESKNS